jgi:predicted transglutaminase-like cysteine proteinase
LPCATFANVNRPPSPSISPSALRAPRLAFAHREGRAGARPWAWRLRAVALAALLVAGALAQAWDQERLAQAAQRSGPRAVAALPSLQALLQTGRSQDDPARLQAANQYFNRRIQFRPDSEVWGQVDYWASPLQSLEAGAGDCEDYAIAKYFSLVAMGMPMAKLRLVYVRAQLDARTVQAHMVLAYYPRPLEEPLILDNLVGDIRSASARPDLAPVFSFNGEGLWQGVGQSSEGDPTVRLSRWRELLARVKAEGFF